MNLLSLRRLLILLVGLAVVSPVTAATPRDIKAILKELKVKQGICLVLGAPDATLPVELARASEFLIYVQCESAQETVAARKAADAAGMLGKRIYVAQGSWKRLHLADRLVDAVIVANNGKEPTRQVVKEIDRVRLRYPSGYCVTQNGEMILPPLEPSPPPGHADNHDWTHPYHGPDNNPQSNDPVARAPYLTKFLAEPFFGPMPEVTVTCNGRMFKAFGHISFKEREWPLLNKLYCMSAYNGTIFWKRDLTPGFNIHRNTIVAMEDELYLGDNSSCKVIDAVTGKIRREITFDKSIGAGPAWKWMAIDDGVLYAVLGDKEPLDKTLRGTRTTAGWPWSGLGRMYDKKTPYKWGFGRTVVAYDLGFNRVLWHHSEKEPIDGRAIAMNGKYIFCYSEGKFLTAIDRKSGKPAWKTTDVKLLAAIGNHNPAQSPRLGYSTTCYMKCSDDAVYFAGPQRNRLVAVSAKDGKLLWQYKHGNYQLVLRKDGLYAMGRTDTSRLFDLLSGEILADLECNRGNCTRATGTVDAIFSRGHPHTGTLRLDLTSTKAEATRIPLMRPACQDGVVVSNGQLFWGPWMCDCNLQLVGVISLTSAGDFNFQSKATNDERLLTAPGRDPADVAPLKSSPADWPAYRSNNRRQGTSSVAISATARRRWQYTPKTPGAPAAPVAAGGLVFLSGIDGAVRAVDAKTGSARWTAYTSGPIKYPPAIWQGRVFVGSCDGWVYSFEAASGELLWKFRAAPVERTIPVYGTLSSTWPVASGVLVEDGVVYAAAGIASYDGTHVYALDAKTGRLRWQNNDSGRLVDKKDRVTGISVQGHLLLHEGRLYMPGGNVVSPAIYDAQNGKCLNVEVDEWQKGPRGRELFLVDGQVRVFDQLLYSPSNYQQGRYFAKGFFVQAGSGRAIVRGTQGRLVRLNPDKSKPGKPVASWQFEGLAGIAALAVTKNAVLAAGKAAAPPEKSGAGKSKPAKDAFLLMALDLTTGKTLWSHSLPAPPSSWGLAVDRDGHVLVSLRDGRVVCFQ